MGEERGGERREGVRERGEREGRRGRETDRGGEERR